MRILHRRRSELAPGADYRVRELLDGDPLARRVRIGTYPCDCGAELDVYEHDPRARSWLRGECPTCRAWCDIDPALRDVVVATKH